ncbi:MAG: PLAT/LH2 domain-containing protein [Bacteroidota bacterium]
MIERQKRPFYIIAHNPNTIEEAREYLNKGVNAIEPDILHVDGTFYVCHHALPSYEGIPTVQEYLRDLKALLLDREYDLSLMIWDMKETDFDINDFVEIVRENFSGAPFDAITMLITHGDAHEFVNRYNGKYDNIAVGVDESNVPPAELEEIFRNGGQTNISYADGITTFLAKPGVYGNIISALSCRDKNEPGTFGFIYTWVLAKEASMRRYLDTYLDGIMVDPPAVERLRKLVTGEPYNEIYRLATNGDNPFKKTPIPHYQLDIKTSGKLGAGTDARIIFTLAGSNSRSLKSLPVNGNDWGAFERGTITQVLLEGIDVGEIESLTIEPITAGLTAAWLPESITVNSNWLQSPVSFDFSDSDNEWVRKKTGPLVKYPTAVA